MVRGNAMPNTQITRRIDGPQTRGGHRRYAAACSSFCLLVTHTTHAITPTHPRTASRQRERSRAHLFLRRFSQSQTLARQEALRIIIIIIHHAASASHPH